VARSPTARRALDLAALAAMVALGLVVGVRLGVALGVGRDPAAAAPAGHMATPTAATVEAEPLVVRPVPTVAPTPKRSTAEIDDGPEWQPAPLAGDALRDGEGEEVPSAVLPPGPPDEILGGG
jgi:hypothetical protein